MTTTNGTSGLADLVGMARERVKGGTIGDLDTPAILRQIARDHLGTRVPKLGDLVVTEFDVRPGVRGIWLTTVMRNDHRLVLIGSFERACHRMLVKIVRRLVRFVATPILIFPVPKSSESPRPTVRAAESMVLVRPTRVGGEA